MRSLNPRFLAGLTAAGILLGVVAYFAHERQMQRNAAFLRMQAGQAVAQGDLNKAVRLLGWYVNLKPDDPAGWLQYAEKVDETHPEGTDRTEVFLVYERALLVDARSAKLRKRCAEIAIDIGRPLDAGRHLDVLIEQAEKDGRDALVRADLEEMRARAFVGAAEFGKAIEHLDKAIKNDATRFSCYTEKARLLRSNLGDPAAADDCIKQMVDANRDLGRAYLYRFRYNSEFHPPADRADFKEAMGRSPEDPEVLLTASNVAEQDQDMAVARAHLENARKLDPRDIPVLTALARLDARQERFADAEATLKEAYQAKPLSDLAFGLAETLILENKIEGPGAASEYLDVLRQRGLGETLGRYLEARIDVQLGKWDQAVPKLETAEAVLKGVPQVSVAISLLLAEGYAKLGRPELRLAALRKAAEGGIAAEPAKLALAQALTESGDIDQALSILVLLAESRPELKLEIARLSVQQNLRKPPERRNWNAIEKQLSISEREPRPGDGERLNLLRAEILAAKGAPAEAREALEAASARDRKNVKYSVALAQFAEAENNPTEALRILDQAEKELGRSVDAAMPRLDHWLRRGDSRAKDEIARIAVTRQDLPPADRARFLDRLAQAERRLGEPALARKYWLELSALEPTNVSVLSRLFDLALEAKAAGEAAKLVSQMRNVEGESGSGWRFALALQLIDTAGRGDRASLSAARTLSAEIARDHPEWWGASILIARIAELENDPEQAASAYREAIKLGNSQPWVIRRLLRRFYEAKQFDDIEQLGQTLRERESAFPEFTLVKAVNASRREDYSQALALARRAISDSSTSFSDHLTLGRFCNAAGHSAEAGKHFKREVELAPGLPGAWLTYVSYLLETKQADQAKSAIDEARQALPTDGATVALCLTMIGDTTQAEGVIRSTLKTKPTDGPSLRVAVALCLATNRLEQVVKYLDAIVQPARNPTDEDRSWANRNRALLLIRHGHSADLDKALVVRHPWFDG
jgi:predicted Zn-dependent protease